MYGNTLKAMNKSWLDDLPNLELLNVGSNGISSLADDLFNSSINLRKLYLYNNNLTYLDPKIFQPLKNIKYITLIGNKLNQTKADFDLTGLIYLTEFYIQLQSPYSGV